MPADDQRSGTARTTLEVREGGDLHPEDLWLSHAALREILYGPWALDESDFLNHTGFTREQGEAAMARLGARVGRTDRTAEDLLTMPGSNELEEVRTREELVEFLGVLLERLRTGSDEEFANRTLEQFLEAAAAAVDSLPGLYGNHGLVLAEQPTWGVIGLIFEAASLLD